MFAALCMNPDFFKKRMKLFVSIAPVVYMSNMPKKARVGSKKLGMEIVSQLMKDGDFDGSIKGPAMEDVCRRAMRTLGPLGMVPIMDEDPSKISVTGGLRHMKFSPAGTSM